MEFSNLVLKQFKIKQSLKENQDRVRIHEVLIHVLERLIEARQLKIHYFRTKHLILLEV